MQAYQENISAKVSGVLSPVLGVQVTVTDAVTGNLAALYSDNGVTSIGQPLTTDETGFFSFYAANGSYVLSFDSPQVRLGAREIKLYDPFDDQPLTQAQAAVSTGAERIGFGQRTVAGDLAETVKLTRFILAPEITIDAAFARAFASFTRPGTLEIPQGFFNIGAGIPHRTDIPIKIRGAGINSTIISYSGASTIASMFYPVDSGITDTFEFSGMTLLGNSKAGSAYSNENIIASSFHDLCVQGTTVVALHTNNGYSNTFRNLKLFNNLGGGLKCAGVNNNNIALTHSQIYANSGIGVELGNGYGITLHGNDIESNAVAGVVAYDIKGLKFSGVNYMERNGATGYAYTTVDGSPENLTVHADIHLLSGGKTIGGARATAVCQVSIDSVQFTPYGTGNVPTSGLSIDSPIFATVADGLRVTNCEVLDSSKIKQMVSFYNNNAKSSAYQCVVDGNTVNSVGFLGTGYAPFSFSTAHNIDTPLAQGSHNYAPQNLFDYADTLLGGTTGTFVRSASDHSGYPVFELSGNRQFGVTLDLSKYPELKGQPVWFGAWVHVTDTGSGVQLYLGGNTDSDGSGTDTAMTTGSFVFRSVCRVVGASDTSLVVGMQRIGTGSNPILVCNPIVSLVGFGANRYPIPNVAPIWRHTAAPSSGTWQVGDCVQNRTPAVGQPKRWLCTTTPATFVSEGNL